MGFAQHPTGCSVARGGAERRWPAGSAPLATCPSSLLLTAFSHGLQAPPPPASSLTPGFREPHLLPPEMSTLPPQGPSPPGFLLSAAHLHFTHGPDCLFICLPGCSPRHGHGHGHGTQCLEARLSFLLTVVSSAGRLAPGGLSGHERERVTCELSGFHGCEGGNAPPGSSFLTCEVRTQRPAASWGGAAGAAQNRALRSQASSPSAQAEAGWLA